jgi:hypothetical protein
MKRMSSFLVLLFTSLLLMVVALYNGFPLVESDTGAYIEKGILNLIPSDRSPFYGWFIRYTSMWASLWYTEFVQCLLLGFLLVRYISRIYGGRVPKRIELVLIIIIVSFTCVAWVSAYLMPDVFAAILLLAALLYLTGNAESKWTGGLYCIIIFAATIIHNSHFPILLVFSVPLIVWGIFKKHSFLLKRSLVLLALSVASCLLMCSINAGNGYGFTYSRGSHVFMMTKFAETGILTKYLNETCPTKDLKLCKYKDEIPDYSWDFLWSSTSPLYKTGGWDSSKKEFDIIIHDVLTTPRYLNIYAQSAATGTLRELTQVQAPYHTSLQGVWSSPWQRIGTFFDDELNEYTLAKHYTDGISANNNMLYLLFFILTSFPVLLLWPNLEEQTKLVYGSIILFLIANAFITSLGSTVIYRFQYRVFWILPATNAIVVLKYLMHRQGKSIIKNRRE